MPARREKKQAHFPAPLLTNDCRLPLSGNWTRTGGMLNDKALWRSVIYLSIYRSVRRSIRICIFIQSVRLMYDPWYIFSYAN